MADRTLELLQREAALEAANAQLQREQAAQRRRAERLEILRGIDWVILSAQAPEPIAEAALGFARRLIPCLQAGILLASPGEAAFSIFAVDGDGEFRGSLEGPIVRKFLPGELDSLRLRQVVTIDAGQLRARSMAGILAGGGRAVFAVPLIAQGELLGCLSLTMGAPGALSEEQQDDARQIADLLAIAIQQARLRAQIERHTQELEQRVADRTRELAALYEVTAIAGEPLELNVVLARSLERVLAALRSSAGTVHLLDPDGRTLRLAVQQGIPESMIPRIEAMPADDGLGARVLTGAEPLIESNLGADPRLGLPQPMRVRYVIVPLRSGGRVAGMLGVARAAMSEPFGPEDAALLTSLGDRIGAALESARLRELAERAAVMEERQRLARDLHDSVTQSLYSLTLIAETGRRAALSADAEKIPAYMERLRDVAQQALKEMRLLIYQLRPLALERGGLAGALQERLDAVEGRAGVTARLLVEDTVSLRPPVEEAFYRIALEALNNALKHSGATSVTVCLRADGKHGELTVTDNGCGFDHEAAGDTGGLGLRTMRERAERLGGTLVVRSALGQGTTVEARI